MDIRALWPVVMEHSIRSGVVVEISHGGFPCPIIRGPVGAYHKTVKHALKGVSVSNHSYINLHGETQHPELHAGTCWSQGRDLHSVQGSKAK